MSNYTKKFKLSTEERRHRTFSEDIKRAKVREIEEGRATPSEVIRSLEIAETTIYRWIRLYSNRKKPIRTIVEAKSDTQKILALQKKIAELERILGQKQVEIEFKDKMIEIAEKMYNVDIKKKLSGKQ